MANELKGEVDLSIGDKTYTLKFTRNAMADIESLFGGRPFNEILADRSVSVLRACLWGGLKAHHQGIDLLAAGDLMEVADDAALGTAIGKAVQLAFVKNGRPQ